jgi:large subunit ribosomal protein L9
MKIILLQHVKGLGQKGEIKEVSEGYFRNALLPKKLAGPASEGQIKQVHVQQEKAIEKLQAIKESALAVKAKLEGQQLELRERASDTGKLYASVTSKEVSQAILAQFKVEIPAKSIRMEAHLKNTGTYPLLLELHKGVQAKMTLLVHAE